MELRCTVQNSVCGFKVKIPRSYLLPCRQTPLFDLSLVHFIFILVQVLAKYHSMMLSVNAEISIFIKSECLLKGQSRNRVLKQTALCTNPNDACYPFCPYCLKIQLQQMIFSSNTLLEADKFCISKTCISGILTQSIKHSKIHHLSDLENMNP